MNHNIQFQSTITQQCTYSSSYEPIYGTVYDIAVVYVEIEEEMEYEDFGMPSGISPQA